MMVHKKTMQFFVAAGAAAALVFGIFESGSAAPVRGKMLVLGFESGQLNDLQDRLLRETIMRELAGRKIRLVPVTEIERLSEEDGKKTIRKASDADLKRLCMETGADFALFGKIAPAQGTKKSRKIERDSDYQCRISLYSATGGRIQKILFKVSSGRDLASFFEAVARTLADRVSDKSSDR